MKWIEPENGGEGCMANLGSIKTIKKGIRHETEILFEDGLFKWKYPDSDSRDADYDRIRKIAMGGDRKEVIGDPYPMNESEWDKDPAPIQQIDQLEQKRADLWDSLALAGIKEVTVNGKRFNFQSDGAEWNLDPKISTMSPVEQKRQKFHQMVLVQIGKRIKVHFHPVTEVPYYEFENDDLRRAFEEICRIPMIQERGK